MWKTVAALVLLAGAAGAADTSLSNEVEHYLANAAPEAADAPGTFRAFWKEGLRFETSDGNFKMRVLGRLYWDTQWGSSDDFDHEVTEDRTYFRTVRLGVSGDLYENVFFKVEIDFIEDDDGVQLKDVYMGLKNLGFLGRMKAGHFKEPFALEELTSPNYGTFIEKSAPTSAFAPSRNAGIQFDSTAFEKKMTWAVGIFKAVDNQGNDLGDDSLDGGYNLTLRLTGLLLEDEEVRRFVHVGFGFIFRDPSGEAVRFRARPGIAKGPRLVDTGSVPADDVMLVDFEVSFNYGSFNFQSEVFLAEVSGAAGAGDPSFTGFYFQVSWWVTGENRRYDRGVYARVKPNRNLHDGGGGWGALEVAYRFDKIDLADGAVAGGEQTTHTIGVNWHWNPNARVMLNAVLVDLDPVSSAFTGTVPADGTGELTVFVIRFQFDF